MQQRSGGLLVWVIATVIFLFGIVGACSAGGDDPPPSTNVSSAKSGGGIGGSFSGAGGGTGGVGGDPIMMGDIEITPQDVVLDVVVGQPVPTQVFTATLHGQDVSNNVEWVIEKPLMADMNGAELVPTAKAGGIGKLRAIWDEAKGETTITINITNVVNTANLSPTEQSAFDTPIGPDPLLNILYPFNATVMPLRIASPEWMWVGGQVADVYRMRLKSKHYDYTQFFTTPPPGWHLLPQDVWEWIQFSGTGPMSDPLEVELARKSGTNVYEAKTMTLHIAQGFVYGSVYYWQLPDACNQQNFNGKVLRIRPDSPQTEEFAPPNTGCFGCHAVSRDGKKMVATYADQGFSLQTLDLTNNPATPGGIGPNTIYGNIATVNAAFNDDGTRIIYWEGDYLHIADSSNGAPVTQSAIGPYCGEPAWSPDGTKVATICDLFSTTGTLDLVNVNSSGTIIGAQTTIVPTGTLVGRPAYPSFTPDSQYLVYGRPSDGSSSSFGTGSIWLTDLSGNAKQLTNLDPGGDNRNYNPVVAPKSAGGFHWMVVISRRNYGHRLLGTDRQQLWLVAVDDPPTSDDPSHPPIYLRGQEWCDLSMNAYYALDPCKEIGEECSVGIECCNGQCVYDPVSGDYVCGEPGNGECIQTGNACELDGDCCNYPEETCYQGFCTPLPPQ